MSEDEILILCGGRGTRLSSVWQKPKILAPIGETTYLEIILKTLFNLNENFKITLATGYKSDQIANAVKKIDGHLSILKESTELGTGGAVTNFIAKRKVDRFTVINGDTLYSKIDINDFFQKSKSTRCSLIAVKKVHTNHRYGSVKINPTLSIVKSDEPKVNDLVFAGLATFETCKLQPIKSIPFALEMLINHSKINSTNVSLYELSSDFYDIGTPQFLAGAQQWLAKN